MMTWRVKASLLRQRKDKVGERTLFSQEQKFEQWSAWPMLQSSTGIAYISTVHYLHSEGRS